MNRGRRNSGRIPAVEDAQLAKTVAQSFLILTTVHPSASAWLSACSAPTRLSNLALRRHAGGGAAASGGWGEERASADLVPDPHRLLRAVGHHPYGVATLPVGFDEADLHHDRLGAT